MTSRAAPRPARANARRTCAASDALLTAQNIAREKELGTLEQLNVTPITRGQFVAGKLVPFWIIGMAELALGQAVLLLRRSYTIEINLEDRTPAA